MAVKRAPLAACMQTGANIQQLAPTLAHYSCLIVFGNCEVAMRFGIPPAGGMALQAWTQALPYLPPLPSRMESRLGKHNCATHQIAPW